MPRLPPSRLPTASPVRARQSAITRCASRRLSGGAGVGGCGSSPAAPWSSTAAMSAAVASGSPVVAIAASLATSPKGTAGRARVKVPKSQPSASMGRVSTNISPVAREEGGTGSPATTTCWPAARKRTCWGNCSLNTALSAPQTMPATSAKVSAISSDQASALTAPCSSTSGSMTSSPPMRMASPRRTSMSPMPATSPSRRTGANRRPAAAGSPVNVPASASRNTGAPSRKGLPISAATSSWMRSRQASRVCSRRSLWFMAPLHQRQGGAEGRDCAERARCPFFGAAGEKI